MSNRKFVYHGSKRKVVKDKVYAATDAGAQALDVDNVDIVKVATVASTGGVQLTINLANPYVGQIVYVDFDSNDACDTLTVEVNGTTSSVDVANAITANQRSLSRVVILDVDDGSEKASQELDNANIT